MVLSTADQLLDRASENAYAVGAFNICNLEFCRAVLETAEEQKSPVILAAHPVEIEFAGLEALVAIVESLALEISVPVALHLDHAESYETVIQCLRAGFTSIMFDGSSLAYEDNIRETKRVVEAARAVGIPVEGELGMIGGKEGGDANEIALTDPDMVPDFVEKTGVYSLAVAIGTAHGLYTSEPHLDLELLGKIRRAVDNPLVLHGGSDLEDRTVRQAIDGGICKINIATELKIAYKKGIFREENEKIYDPLIINRRGMESAKGLVKRKMKLFSSSGRAG